jgi:dolichol-phosphate mannosyltransferase
MDSSKLTLILPTLNERDNIVPQIKEVLNALPQIGQILVVDDNSTDGTLAEVESAFYLEIKSQKIKTIHRKSNFGLTPSLKEGIEAAKTELVGWMDCDLSMPANLLPEMLEELDSADICIGSRFIAGGGQKDLVQTGKDSRLVIVASSFLNKNLTKILKLPITDLTSGFIVAKKSYLYPLTWRGSHGEYFLPMTLQATQKGAKIVELPYQCGTRKYGKSKTFGSVKAMVLNPLRYIGAVVRVLRA